MLQINLLPVRQMRRREAARRNFWIMIALCLITLALLIGGVIFLSGRITSLRNKQAALEAEKAKYNKVIAEIKKLEKQKEELERKMGVIKQLKADSSLTVRVLDEVAKLIDPQRMWLTTLGQQGSSLSLTGVALDSKSIAEYMERLEESPFVNTVDLDNASLTVISGSNLQSFKLNCTVSYPVEKKEGGEEDGGQSQQ